VVRSFEVTGDEDLAFEGEKLQWNHLAAFVCLILAVYFVFMK